MDHACFVRACTRSRRCYVAVLSTPVLRFSALFVLLTPLVNFLMLSSPCAMLLLGTVDASSSHAAWQAAGCPRHNVPRARDTRVPHPLPTCASSDALAAVRCCGPQQCTSVCRRDADETCALTSIDSRLTSFAEAGAECAAHGRRLCTRRELEDGKCCRAGCNMDGVLVWSSDACASTTAVRPLVAAPVSTSNPTALPCAIATPRGFGPCCDRGSLRASPNDALLNFSFLKRHPSGYLGAAQQRLPVNKVKELRAGEARLCSSADGRACSFNPTIEQAMALLGPAPQPGTFVDVGANGGWETRHALAAGMNVLVVECLPEAYRELLGIFHGVPAARLRLLHACASNSTGVATLHRAADSSSMIVNNVRSGPEALKAQKERTKESQVQTVVLDSELLPTGTPDSASLRVDVRLVKIDTQVAPRHESNLRETQIPHCRLDLQPPSAFPTSPYSLYRAAGERASRAIRVAPHSPQVATPHLFREQPNGHCFTCRGRSDAVDRAIKLHLHARYPGHALCPC